MLQLNSERCKFESIFGHRGENGGPQCDFRGDLMRWHAEGYLGTDRWSKEFGSCEG